MPILLNEFEIVVLSVVMDLRGEGYGMTIRQRVADLLSRDVNIGVLYSTLGKLEAQGVVACSVGLGTADRGGRKKTIFRITADGEAVRRSAIKAFQPGERPQPLGVAL